MHRQPNNFNGSKMVLENIHLRTLKSLSMLLTQEISLLERQQASLEKEIENRKPICLVKEIQQFESNLIRCALIHSMGNQTKAARLLGLKISTLNTKIKRYKIELT